MNDAQLLDLWETAWPLAPAVRARALANASGNVSALGAAPSLGAQHAALLNLRARLFGPSLALRAGCPRCQGALDFKVDVDTLLHAQPSMPETAELSLGTKRVVFRALGPNDLTGLPDGISEQVLARQLFERCVIEAFDGEDRVAPESLGAEVQSAIAKRLEAIDPDASLGFSLKCPDCDLGFEAALDPAAVVWSELRHAAEQLLADVVALAGAFGWREAEVLAMPPARRGAYLQFASAACRV
jgi:hypothetical protein